VRLAVLLAEAATAKPATVKRLEQLRDWMLQRVDAYYKAVDAGREPSAAFYSRFDEYDAARGTPAWAEYCAKHGYSTSHRALDNFA
jgi:hypothetical protein